MVCNIFYSVRWDSRSLQPFGGGQLHILTEIYIYIFLYIYMYYHSQLRICVLDLSQLGFEDYSFVVSQIRTLGMLRSRFKSVPSAFSDRLMPSSEIKDAKKKKHLVVLSISSVFTLHSCG